MNKLNYRVYDSKGRLMMAATLPCRYDRETERNIIQAGYTIKIDGKKLTKKEVGA